MSFNQGFLLQPSGTTYLLFKNSALRLKILITLENKATSNTTYPSEKTNSLSLMTLTKVIEGNHLKKYVMD